jgi:CBS domain-containing protein
MERYGQDFDRDRWSGRGESWRGGRGQGMGGGGWGAGGSRGRQGGGWEDDFEGGGEFGGGRGRMGGGYGSEFDEWSGGQGGQRGGEWGGRQGGGGFGGGGQGGGGQGGGYGGQRFGQQRQGGGEYMGGGYGGAGYGGAGYGGGYGGGGYGGGYGEEQQGGASGGGQWGGEDYSSRVRASEIMTENPETLTPNATLADAARKMRDLNVGIIPVIESQENRRLKGVITDRDIAIRAVAEGKDANNTKVSDVMTTDVETCNKNDSVRDILNVMQREQVRRVPITDREGRLVGIVAQADVAVDYMEEQPEAKRDVARTLRRVSEPAEPEGAGMQARGRTGGGRTAARGGQQKSGTTRSSQQRGEE